MTSEITNKFNSTGFGKTEDQIAKFSNNTGKKIGAMASDLADSASEHLQSSRDYVKENPTKGVVIAAATGMVVGSLLTMAMRRNNK